MRKGPDNLDLTLMSRACAEGRHRQCLRQVLLPAATRDGKMYATCVCPTCRHVSDYRKAR